MNAFFVCYRNRDHSIPSRVEKIRFGAGCLVRSHHHRPTRPPRARSALAMRAICASKQAEAEHFFESKVRSSVAGEVLSCHASQKTATQGCGLDSRQGILSEMVTAATAVVPFQPDEESLMEAVRRESLEMPRTEHFTPTKSLF